MPSRVRSAKSEKSEETALPRDLSGERFRLVVEAAPNAIIVTNSSGLIELVNKQAEELFHYTREEMLGRQVEMLIPERFRHNHPSLRDQFMSEPSTRSMGAGRDLYAHTKDGREIPIEIGLNPIHTEEGMLVLSSIIDISERKATEERFRLQTEQIAAASRYKSEFLANMSHELRTPLNSILILSEQLKNNVLGNLSAKQVTHADIIHRSGSDLLALINDILDLSKIEAGRMSVLLETITMTEFAASVDRSFRPMAEAKNLEFFVVLDSDAPPVIFSDHQRIFQIIRNLFSNALKFTNGGTIRIVFSLASSSKGEEGMLGIAVSDTGIGIPADKHDMIFDAFRQVDGSTSRRFGGTGLGLSISRSLATLLGGEIRLQSAPGQGSTFTLVLPRGLVRADTISLIAQSTASQVRPVGAQVLLVEDNPVEARHYAGLIRELGYQVTICGNAQCALKACRRRRFSCLVIDLALPDKTGIELIEQLKAESLLDETAIIVNTALSLGDVEVLRLRGCGAVVLSKSVEDEHKLLEAVRMQLSPVNTLVIEEINVAAAPANTIIAKENFNGKRILVVDDDVRNIYAMSSILEELGFEIDVAKNGQQALDFLAEHDEDIDLVLMDMMMPVLDGYQATRELKFARQFGKPIVALTAHAMKGDREKCLAAGANDYLAKPITHFELVDMLHKWL
jgi:PAS domain S-box-containing protein